MAPPLTATAAWSTAPCRRRQQQKQLQAVATANRYRNNGSNSIRVKGGGGSCCQGQRAWAAGRLLAKVTAERRHMAWAQRGSAVDSMRDSRSGARTVACGERGRVRRISTAPGHCRWSCNGAPAVGLIQGRLIYALHGWRRAAAFPCSLQSRLARTVRGMLLFAWGVTSTTYGADTHHVCHGMTEALQGLAACFFPS